MTLRDLGDLATDSQPESPKTGLHCLVTPRSSMVSRSPGSNDDGNAYTPPVSPRLPDGSSKSNAPPLAIERVREVGMATKSNSSLLNIERQTSMTPGFPSPRLSPQLSLRSIRSFEPAVLPPSCSEDDIDMAERTFGEPAELKRQSSRMLTKAPSREWDRTRSPLNPRDLQRSGSGTFILKRMNSKELVRSASKGSRELVRSASKEWRTSSGSTPQLKQGPLIRALKRDRSDHSLGNISISSSRSPPTGDDLIKSAQAVLKMHRTGTSLDEWWGFVPNNSHASRLFSESELDVPITLLQFIFLVVVVLIVEVAIIVVFSQIGSEESPSYRGLQVHYWVLKMGWCRLPLACVLSMSWFCLHMLEWLEWPRSYTIPIGASFFSGLMLVLVLSCHAYPHAPLIVASLCVPAILAVARAQVVKCRPADFYKAATGACIFSALAILVLWTLWVAWASAFGVGISQNWWNRDTEARLRQSEWMVQIEEEYMSPGWSECVSEVSKTGQHLQPTEVLACRKVKLTAFLVWFSPVIQVVWLCSVAGICLTRAALAETRINSQRFDKILWGSITLASVGLLSLWAWASVSGESLEASVMVIGFAGAGFLSLCAWLYCSVDIRIIVRRLADRPWCQALRPMLVSDYFTSVLLILFGPLLLAFFIIECLVRWVELLRRIDVGGRPWMLTRRSEKMLAVFSGWHWGSICENAIYWCWLFLLINVLAVQMSVVFFAWLNAQLVESFSFGEVCIVFYFIGLLMFLIPVIPGIPVYLSAGIVLVHVARGEPWLRFEGGIIFAVMECMVLKLHAHVMQQKLFGEFLGQYMWIQKIVGVHKVGIRAIKAILLEPGLKLKKVTILCGGPDWPTSVLTGILHLSTCQMLFGMLPVIFLIIPCVATGSFLLDSDYSGVTSIAMVIMTVFQGGAMLAALLIVLYDVDHHYDKLMAWQPENENILKFAQKKEMEDEIRTICTEWVNLTLCGKCCLAGATGLTMAASWCSFLLSSKCFEDFDLSEDFYADLDAGGLDGDALNLLKPLGIVVLSMVLAGVMLFVMYYREASAMIKEIQVNSVEMVVSNCTGVFSSEARSGDESPLSFADESFQGTHHQSLQPGIPARYFEWLPPSVATPTRKGTPPSPKRLVLEVPDSSHKFGHASKLPFSRGPDELPADEWQF